MAEILENISIMEVVMEVMMTVMMMITLMTLMMVMRVAREDYLGEGCFLKRLECWLRDSLKNHYDDANIVCANAFTLP